MQGRILLFDDSSRVLTVEDERRKWSLGGLRVRGAVVDEAVIVTVLPAIASIVLLLLLGRLGRLLGLDDLVSIFGFFILINRFVAFLFNSRRSISLIFNLICLFFVLAVLVVLRRVFLNVDVGRVVIAALVTLLVH